MLSATLEPSLFAPPSANEISAASVRAYVVTLLHWLKASQDNRVALYASDSTAEALILSDSYPLRPWLKEMLSQAHVAEYDFNTIATVAETLLNRATSLEKRIRIADVLVETLTISPNVFATYHNSDLAWASQKIATIIALGRALRDDLFSVGHGFVLRDTQGTSSIGLDLELLAVVHSRPDLDVFVPSLPASFQGEVQVCQQFGDLVMALDEYLLWRKVRNHQDIESVARVAVYRAQVLRGAEAHWGSPSFRIHPAFFSSVYGCGAIQSETLARATLRALVETIERRALTASHALRVGPGPEEEQVTRGKDKAWRRNIDHEYRLHYWMCPGNVPEIATMVTHNDFEIYS